MLQLTSPDTQPQVLRLLARSRKPQLIAWRDTASPALALSKGLDRDRAVDETGDQIAVFGRIGSRPFTLDEMKKFYQRPDGSVCTVTDEVRMQDFVPARTTAAASAAGAEAARNAMRPDPLDRDSTQLRRWHRSRRSPLLARRRGAAPRRRRPRGAAPRRDAPATLPYQSADTSMGVVNCANSLCHGSVQPMQGFQRPADRVRDLVARRQARARLPGAARASSRSASRATSASAKPADQAKICLDCHAHNVPARSAASASSSTTACPARRATARPGAGCRSHVEHGATHADNLDDGLYPTDDPVARAQLCLSCHFGNARPLRHAPHDGRRAIRG